ncbi:MAG TPA: ABC transporter permease, partial [Anaerolineaceae bacterium]
MIQTFKMAFRDLGRNRRRSFFSSLALGIGLALLLLMAGFFQGEMRGAMNDSIRLQSGHLQVRAKSYDETKTSLAWTDLIADPNQVAAQVAAIPQVLLATPRLFATGIIGTSDQSIGVRIIGIDPASAANAPYRDGMVAGTFLTADDRNGVLMGKALADKLGLKSGDTIDLLANTSNGDVDEQVFTIRGVYDTHTPGFDQSALFLPLAKAQALTRTENHASTIFVLLKNIDQTQAVASALQGSQYTVSTYIQLNQIISDTEQLANSYIYMLYLIVLAIT